MKYLQFFFVAFFLNLHAQNDLNTVLLSNLNYDQRCNDIWGYVDSSGIEYAIVGTTASTSIVSLQDPLNPKEIANIPGASSPWRDIKTHDRFAYVTADRGTDGLLIVDLSQLPDSVSHTFWKPGIEINGLTTTLNTCHNLYIDNGFIYLAGCNISNRGVIILDANENPQNPKFVGAADLSYAHDVFVRDKILYSSEIFEGNLGIYNIIDKSNPLLITRQRTSSAFTHNAWSSDDNNFVFTTDERGDASVDAYDVSDKDLIIRTDQYQLANAKGQGIIPHNTHYNNGFLVTSWYTEGIIVIDAHKPENLIRVGQYDTWPGANGGFNGCWGAYPFLPSGLILASDISTGLYVLQPDFQRACYFEGLVIDKETKAPINNADIFILSDEANATTSNAQGIFQTGQASSGSFMAIASHIEYNNDTVTINLVNGESEIVTFELAEKNRSTIAGMINDADSGQPIDKAHVRLVSSDNSFLAASLDDGSYTIEVFGAPVKMLVGKFGFKTKVIDFKSTITGDVNISLEKGISDDFNFDFGWTIEGNAETGQWIRDIPVGTHLDGSASNPGIDYPDDTGDHAYVTGNGGGDAGDDDVDGGSTTLTSPMLNLSDMADPQIEYSLWYFNAGGNGPPNDVMQVFLLNGRSSILVEEITDQNKTPGQWRKKSRVVLRDFISDLSQIQLSIRIVDNTPGHVVEGGFDGFSVIDGTTTSTADEVHLSDITITPNPVFDRAMVESSKRIQSYIIRDLQGRLIRNVFNLSTESIQIDTKELSMGAYLIELFLEGGLKGQKKFIKARM